MLRSPDNPNSNLRSHVPTETHRRRPEVTMADAYSFGIEEEYFLVDAHSKLVARDMPNESSVKQLALCHDVDAAVDV